MVTENNQRRVEGTEIKIRTKPPQKFILLLTHTFLYILFFCNCSYHWSFKIALTIKVTGMIWIYYFWFGVWKKFVPLKFIRNKTDKIFCSCRSPQEHCLCWYLPLEIWYATSVTVNLVIYWEIISISFLLWVILCIRWDYRKIFYLLDNCM